MTAEAGETCRVDVWLWRARFFKTRGLAAAFVEAGRVRLTRAEGRACDREARLDKPSRTVRPGDALVFAVGGRLVAVRIESCGERRGPASEARTLYSDLDAPSPEVKAADFVAESGG
ncbi:RNA-binding S4 domain-containing protein [Caulobacter sp. 17J65-9]|uniref:RNA-binding S4 domain-containing protein n=1 Tax=Caulobacter sp. 17J65-9 TaxID=2709382 RepID=UPI0013C721E0|nr:RNA-binding S4 domain-containing protein [Caulobacter sp. 17J65-9]NEX92195.1 RNA-binding S4 domain-containing protein [Caulobacter sp. 17J65-9]